MDQKRNDCCLVLHHLPQLTELEATFDIFGKEGGVKGQIDEEGINATLVEKSATYNISKVVLTEYYAPPNDQDLLIIQNRFSGLKDLTISTLDAARWISRRGIITSDVFKSFFGHTFQNVSNFKFTIR